MVGNFAVALAFMYRLIADSSPSGGLPGGTNSAWDLKIAFHASRGASLSGVPVLLVSDDARLRQAARDAREALRVVAMADYTALLSDAGAIGERAVALRRPT